MAILVEYMIVAGAKNRKKNGRMMLESIENGPLVYPIVEEDGLPPDVYAIVNHCQSAKDIWERVKLLMKGTELSYQERECKLHNEFDKFTSIKGETLHEYYLRFAQLINNVHTIGMTMHEVQVNTKFLNALQPEWSKFMTDVKLAKNMYNTNHDQLYAYLSQHKGHENEVRMLRERYQDPLALVANHQTQTNSAQYLQQLSSTSQTTHSSQPYQQGFQPQINHSTPSVPHNAYHSPIISPQLQAVFPQLDSGLVVMVFLPGDDPIACLNKAMAFMSTVVASRFSSTNNQLRSSSNPRNQATIQDGRVTVQQVQGRQGQGYKNLKNTNFIYTDIGNDSEDLGKLKPKAYIGIFIGYAPTKKAFRIYNKRTRLIIENIHVAFDELTAMASEQFSSGPGPQLLTPGTLSSGLVSNPPSSTPYVPPTKNDWDILFQPMFDEFSNPLPSVVSPVPAVAARRPADLTGSLVSTSIGQDVPSSSNPSTQEQEQSPIISQGVEESLKTPHFHDDPLHETLHEDSTSQGSSSNVRPSHTPLDLLGKWTKNHPLANVIEDPSRSVFTRKQLKTDAM
ncbi:hypothetical protein Tco_0527251 [Tanacetum coccineum]